MENNNTNPWWAYRHINGSIQVKRYFGPRDIEEAMESDFVETTTAHFQAADREEAIAIAKKLLS